MAQIVGQPDSKKLKLDIDASDVNSDDASNDMRNGDIVDNDISDAPLNLSKKAEPTKVEPEPPLVRKYKPKTTEERMKLVAQLREELRNEEAILLLMKKIRHSQRTVPTTNNNNSGTTSVAASTKPQITTPSLPSTPTLQLPKNFSSSSNSKPSHSSTGKPQLPTPRHVPPTVPSRQSTSVSKPSVPSAAESAETLKKRKEAAKLALRKQLEKTLLQIPPPKPPPPQLNFVPNPNQMDFIILLGLDEVVRSVELRRAHIKEDFTPKEPLVCFQCGIDYTPVWLRDPAGHTVCEQCASSNQKRSLKQEHTQRLKMALVNALQQEQELEKQIEKQLSQSASEQSAPAAVSTASSSSSSSNSRNLLSSEAMASLSSAGFPPGLFNASMFSEHIRQQQLQVYQAHLQQLQRAGIPLFPSLPFPFPMPNPKGHDPRQYLLDMIPQRPWK